MDGYVLKLKCKYSNILSVIKYGKKEAGTGEHLTHFNNKINKHKWKAAAPHGRLPHTKHKLKSRPGPLSSSTVVTPHLTLPKLLRGTRDRWVAQVSFITNYSTGLAPFPRLSAPPHSSHWDTDVWLSLAVSSNYQNEKQFFFEVFYFTCNESKIYESFTFWNKLHKKCFTIFIFLNVPVCSKHLILLLFNYSTFI